MRYDKSIPVRSAGTPVGRIEVKLIKGFCFHPRLCHLQNSEASKQTDADAGGATGGRIQMNAAQAVHKKGKQESRGAVVSLFIVL